MKQLFNCQKNPKDTLINNLTSHLRHKDFVQAIIRWYRVQGRDLPWRRTNDPYAIWISEIMLQQTQVDTVIPYYHRFMEAFPNVYSLAHAPMDEIYKLWEGPWVLPPGQPFKRGCRRHS